MSVYVPPRVKQSAATKTLVQANVFAGSERSTVRLRVNDGPWHPMTRTPGKDPSMTWVMTAMKQPEPWLGSKYTRDTLSDCHHLWQAALPAEVTAGTHRLEVEAADMFGQTARGMTLFRVLSA